MSLKIHFQGGQRAGDVVELDDEVERIVIGRDTDRCQIAFPPDETKVGREHLALKRQLGRYRLELNKDNLVMVDGQVAINDQELGPIVDIQLGPNGPKLVVETELTDRLPATDDQGRRRGPATIAKDAEHKAQRGKMIALVAILLLPILDRGTRAIPKSTNTGR